MNIFQTQSIFSSKTNSNLFLKRRKVCEHQNIRKLEHKVNVKYFILTMLFTNVYVLLIVI